MSLIRVRQTTSITLTHTFYVDEVATDASGNVTVTVRRLDGTALVTGAATTHTTDGTYTYVLPGGPSEPSSFTWQLDELLIEWTGNVGGAIITVTDTVEVVGGFLYEIGELRHEHRTALGNATVHPTADLVSDRLSVEQECERICRQAWVPRFARETLSGRGTPYLGTEGKPPNTMLRRVRSITVAGVAWSQDQIDQVSVTDAGYFVRAGGAGWPIGVGNIVIEYEHGNSRPIEPVKTAAMLRARSVASRPSSAVPDRAQSYTTQDGAVFTLSRSDEDRTGIPDVDGPYLKYQRPRRTVAL